MPQFLALLPVPLVTAGVFLLVSVMLRRMPLEGDRFSWAPFAGAIVIVILSFQGLAYGFLPYIVPERRTIWQAAAAPESLMIVFVGAVFVLPVIVGYSALSYWVFRCKAKAFSYG